MNHIFHVTIFHLLLGGAKWVVSHSSCLYCSERAPTIHWIEDSSRQERTLTTLIVNKISAFQSAANHLLTVLIAPVYNIIYIPEY